MKQTFKKKPEFLYGVVVEDDSQSIKEVFDFMGVETGNISFDAKGNRLINVGETEIPVGDVLFKNKKNEVVHMPKDKLLMYYDEYEQEVDSVKEDSDNE